jgi:hypothetical protein
MFYWFKLRYLWVVAAVLVGVAALAWVKGGQGSDNSPPAPKPSQVAATPAVTSSSTPASPSASDSVVGVPRSTSSAPTKPDPSPTQSFKATLDERVKAFVAVYFSVTPPKGATDMAQAIKLSAASSKLAVQPYATTNFMRTATFGYGTSEAGRSLFATKTTKTATADTGLVDSQITTSTASGTVMVHYSLTDLHGIVVDLGVVPQLLTLKKQGQTWFVDAAPLT